jgi:hypothetical protein
LVRGQIALLDSVMTTIVLCKAVDTVPDGQAHTTCCPSVHMQANCVQLLKEYKLQAQQRARAQSEVGWMLAGRQWLAV